MKCETRPTGAGANANGRAERHFPAAAVQDEGRRDERRTIESPRQLIAPRGVFHRYGRRAHRYEYASADQALIVGELHAATAACDVRLQA